MNLHKRKGIIRVKHIIDNSMDVHHLFIHRCFELARLSAGKVSPNPMVGAILVVDGKIVSEGFHQYAGGPHAEINAINSLKNKALLPISTLYVSLEPCNNYGRTPPCVDAVLHYKIPKVVISVIDPNQETMGKSIEKLKATGVEVLLHILEEKGRLLTEGFFSIIQKKRPFIVLKFAKSLNNKIGIANQNYWISNAFTKRLTHKWRSELSAIMVGSNTLKIDNPGLDNRLYFGNSPLKILLKRDGTLPSKMAAFNSKGNIIIVSDLASKTIFQNSVKQWKFPFNDLLLKNILENLMEEGHNSLLVEGGAALINSFLQQNLWDEVRIFTGNKIINHPLSIPAPMPTGKLVNSFKIDDNQLDIIRNGVNGEW